MMTREHVTSPTKGKTEFSPCMGVHKYVYIYIYIYIYMCVCVCVCVCVWLKALRTIDMLISKTFL